MVKDNVKKRLGKRVLRRFAAYKLKLFVLFLVVFSTTAIFISFFVGTSSVLQSVNQFNDSYKVEDGVFQTTKELDKSIPTIQYEQMKYGEIRQDGNTIRVFQAREEINRYQVTNGKDIKSDTEILLDNNFMEANRLKIGENIELNGNNFTIVGTAISPDYITTKNSNLVLQANAKVFGIAFVNNAAFASLFNENYATYYAYRSASSVEEISKLVDPLYINDSRNNTRIQQVIGDAKAPRDLALLLAVLLYLIVLVLLSVYHFEVSKKEKNNLDTFHKLGVSKATLFKHYMMETNVTLALAWFIGGIIGIFSIETIMQMNQKIYNYPILEINYLLLGFCVIVSLLFILSMNLLLVYQFYIKQQNGRSSKIKPGRKQRNSSVIPFAYRYRLKRITRNKKEMALFVILVFFVGLLMNFSFLLKDSVTQYVHDLGVENTFEEILFYSPQAEAKVSGESFKIYNLHDQAGVSQSVYVISPDSDFFHYDLPLKDGDVIITEAFAKKYDKSVGDSLELTDIANEKKYHFDINKINSVSTVSTIYLVSKNGQLMNEETFATPAVAMADSYENSNAPYIEAKLERDEIINSGENILDVINKQITLILSLAVVLLVALLYSLLEFSFQNSRKSIETLKLQGYSLPELMKMHFAFSLPIAIVFIVGSYLLSRLVVRVFLDQIMFDFVNFVRVTESVAIILISNGLIIAIFSFFLLKNRRKINML